MRDSFQWFEIVHLNQVSFISLLHDSFSFYTCLCLSFFLFSLVSTDKKYEYIMKFVTLTFCTIWFILHWNVISWSFEKNTYVQLSFSLSISLFLTHTLCFSQCWWLFLLLLHRFFFESEKRPAKKQKVWEKKR